MENKIKWLSKRIPKSFKKEQLLIMLLAGVLLVIIAIPTSKAEKKDAVGSNTQATSETDIGYEMTVEKKLELALQEVEGVGNVRVMVTLKTSAEKVIEKDAQESRQAVEEVDKEGGKRTTKEGTGEEKTVYDSGQEGAQTPYVRKEVSPRIEGVMVIAQGGDDGVVIKNITEAIQALFDVDTHKIKIMKMNQRK